MAIQIQKIGDITKLYSWTTTVHMLPVCECGQVISNLVLDMYIDEAESGYKYSKFTFTPGRCPNCGKYIECLQVDGRYIDMFKKEES